MNDDYLQHEAEIVERIQNNESITTFRLKFTDPKIHRAYSFKPGQFNMVYLYGVGEVAISIVSDPLCLVDECLYDHTFRAVGRVTEGLAKLQQGDRLGIRGPYGRGWPVEEAKGKEVIILTGGLGCAPTVSAINYILARREEYGELRVIHGVREVAELIHQDLFAAWKKEPNTQVLFSSDKADPKWKEAVGSPVDRLSEVVITPNKTIAMICGPEGMMKAAAEALLKKGMAASDIYLSLERNMKCGIGQCGHCQLWNVFVCKDGPVFPYSEVSALLARRFIRHKRYMKCHET